MASFFCQHKFVRISITQRKYCNWQIILFQDQCYTCESVTDSTREKATKYLMPKWRESHYHDATNIPLKLNIAFRNKSESDKVEPSKSFIKIPDIIPENCSLPANNEVYKEKSQVMHLSKFDNTAVPMQSKHFDKLPPLSKRSSMLSGNRCLQNKYRVPQKFCADQMKDSVIYVSDTSKKEVAMKKSFTGSASKKVNFKNELMFHSLPKKLPEQKYKTNHNIHWYDVLVQQKSHNVIYFRNRNLILTIPRQIALKPKELYLIQHEPLIFEKNKNISRFENANGSILKWGPFVANGVHTRTSYT